MKIRYVFPLDRAISVEDHWPVPLLGGECQLVEENNLVTAIEFTKSGMDASMAFSVIDTPDQKSKATITGNDIFVPVVRDHIKRAFSYLQCFFDTSISIDAVTIYHEAETPEEEEQIVLPSFQIGKKERKPLPLTYDLFTRALMAAEDSEGPDFISSLVSMAREAFAAKRYIDSYRFAFLLIEALYGGGKFKTKQLKESFSQSAALCGAIDHALSKWKTDLIKHPSDTLTLINDGPSREQVIDHLISTRGHYFHGNLNKKGAWDQSKQDEAEALSWLGIGVVQKIASDAASPMFDEEYAKRHQQQANEMGASVKMLVEYKFRVPEDDLLRKQSLDIQMPGTKPTTLMAMEAARQSVEYFRNNLPAGRLHSVRATNKADKEQLFEMRFFTEEDGTEVND
ncbi:MULTISPECIES: hypothetical protein [Parasphingorhabdus]|jgi:hypothetical protein|uniref:Uncharacterized protein n=1 Tax=Parasphingorhabdus halotolerans TaxID=2725558 RepID=A0A6H2DRM9_9SPHN|nr:hypothetical protein [Parasphingorhabdus halotolerans]QJB70316.1 hypothetical protein HF685_14390 [Parasphingorhabdus halotolerans]